MNMFSRCNISVSCDANGTNGCMSHEPCECDVHGVNTVGEILSNSMRIRIPQDSIEAEDSVVDKAANVGLPTYVSSTFLGGISHSEGWSDQDCKEDGLPLNSICTSKGSDSVLEASYMNLPRLSPAASAMKGSREKQGVVCTKLSVSWSHDVYDPVTTIVSHTVKNKQKRQSKSETKSGKGRHKESKSLSKQSAGKHKKQTPKSWGTKNC